LDLHKYLLHKNSNVKGRDGGKQKKCKQKAFATPIIIMKFFGNVRPYKKSNLIQLGFIEDLVLMIAKGYMPLSIVESPWLRQMVLHHHGQVQFLFRKQLVCEHLPILLQKPMATYVLPTFV
jgi:hypothetical protein